MHKLLSISLLLIISFAGTAQTAEEYYQKSQAFFVSENFKSALKSIDEGIDLEEDSVKYHILRSRCCAKLGQYNEGLSSLDDAEDLAPKSGEVQLHRGLFYDYFGKSKEAIDEFSAAIRRAEDIGNDTLLVAGLVGRGKVSCDIRNFEFAEKDFKLALSIDSTDFAALNNYATLLDKANRTEEAIEITLRLIETNPDYGYFYTNLGYYNTRLERYDEAIKAYDKAIALNPEDPFAYNNRGHTKYLQGKNKAALKDIDKSISLYPSNSYAYRNKAMVFFAMEKKEKACEQVALALRYGYLQQYGDDIRELMNKCGYR